MKRMLRLSPQRLKRQQLHEQVQKQLYQSHAQMPPSAQCWPSRAAWTPKRPAISASFRSVAETAQTGAALVDVELNRAHLDAELVADIIFQNFSASG